MPPRNGGRAAAADGGLDSAEAGDPPGTQADSTLDPGANADCGGDGRANQLHHLQQQQLQAAQLQHQALLAQAAQQQWLFGCIGGATAPMPPLTPDLTPVLATLSTIEMRITMLLGPLEAGLADLLNNVAPA
jgi:hypothetical protein